MLTTTEVASMIRKSGIRFENIDGESTDMPFGIGSGGGVIFGVTGGVTEAVLRRLQTGHSRWKWIASAPAASGAMTA